MAAISPSPGSAPSDVPPASLVTQPQPSTPPSSSQATPVQQPNAIPPNPSTSFAQSPSSSLSNPTPASPPRPVDSFPPPTPSAPPPSPASPPPTPILSVPPDPSASPPPPQELSPSPPPPIDPPVISPPPIQAPPPLPPPTPPPRSPPLSTSPTSSPPPPSSSSPPLVSPPTPPSSNPPSNPPPPPPLSGPPLSSPPPPSSQPPEISPPPPSSRPPENPPPPPSSGPPENPPPLPSSRPPENPPPPPSSGPPENPPPPPPSRPPENSPPPPSSNPPRTSPSPPAPQAPESSSSPPAARPPHGSAPSASSGPPSQSDPPPSQTPATPTSVSHVSPSPPSQGPQTTVPFPPILPNNSPPFDAPQTANRAGSSGPSGGVGSGGTAVIGVIAGVLMFGLIGLVAFWIFKRKKKNFGANGGHVIPASLGSSPRSDAELVVKTEYPASLFGGSSCDTATKHGGFGHSRAWFTYQELFEATSGFADQNLLGEGGFGCVYKGLLADGRVVAVKQLKVGATQGEWQFKAEVEIISRIHHRHLVSLVGYCVSESRRLLVYDYVPNNTLHFHLHGEGRPVLDWAIRFRIAAGAARGIAYLHEDCHPRIIHRDIKSSNILLDGNFEARVSDFGLAKLAMDADTHISTRVMGTFGYLAPEYATTGKLTEKSDVYSFGVVLLELITGRRPVDASQPVGDESLVEWARPLLTHALDAGELGGLVDPRLEDNYIENEIFLMIEAAAACVRHSAAKRPRMGQIVRAFDGMSDSRDLSNGLRVGESQLYNSAQQSAEIRWFRRMAFGSQDISTDFFSQPTQDLGFSTRSAHNASFSSRQGQGGNLLRLQSHDARNPVVSGQSGNLLRQQSQDAQNPSFSGQNRQSVYSSAQHDFSGDTSR